MNAATVISIGTAVAAIVVALATALLQRRTGSDAHQVAMISANQTSLRDTVEFQTTELAALRRLTSNLREQVSDAIAMHADCESKRLLQNMTILEQNAKIIQQNADLIELRKRLGGP